MSKRRNENAQIDKKDYNPDGVWEEQGTFQPASAEVLKKRKMIIVSGRPAASLTASSARNGNPFGNLAFMGAATKPVPTNTPLSNAATKPAPTFGTGTTTSTPLSAPVAAATSVLDENLPTLATLEQTKKENLTKMQQAFAKLPEHSSKLELVKMYAIADAKIACKIAQVKSVQRGETLEASPNPYVVPPPAEREAPRPKKQGGETQSDEETATTEKTTTQNADKKEEAKPPFAPVAPPAAPIPAPMASPAPAPAQAPSATATGSALDEVQPAEDPGYEKLNTYLAAVYVQKNKKWSKVHRGLLELQKHTASGKYRMVMRSPTVLFVNMSLTNLTFTFNQEPPKPGQAPKSNIIFVGINAIEDNPNNEAMTHMLRAGTSTEELCSKLKEMAGKK